MQAIFIVLGVLIFFALVVELIHVFVFGLPIKKEFLEKFLDKNLHRYYCSGRMMHNFELGKRPLPYIARADSIFFKWYMEDIGVIPRWSKSSKKLDDYYINDLTKYE